MTARVSPTERIRAEIDELIAGSERGSLLEHFEEVARAAVRLVFQTALETEVTEFFGRERYARGERERQGSRNGYSDMTIKTTAGRYSAVESLLLELHPYELPEIVAVPVVSGFIPYLDWIAAATDRSGDTHAA